MTEKKEKTVQERLSKRKLTILGLGFVLYLIGGLIMMMQIANVSVYQELRSDEYMDDPTIPYNERENATYTFTDEWLSDTHDRLLWYAVPWLIVFAVGAVIVFGTPHLTMKDKEIHENFCKGGEARYCPECGLKLSDLDKK